MGYALFYKSVNGDRVYDDTSFEYWLKKFFTSGVFLNDLQVTANNNMTVNVGTGYVNVDGKVKVYDAETTLSIETAGATYPRIDSIVLERNDTERDIFLKVIKGGYSSEPVAHVPVRQDGIYQLVIAQILVNAGAVKIIQVDITDTRAYTDLCGIVSSTVENIDFGQVQAQFDSWFKQVKGQLSEDAAGNLQVQINEINQAVKNNAEFLEKLKAAPVNNNILINSNFANPVNQRGYAGEVTTKSMYTIDRWKLNSGQSFDISSNGITFKKSSTNAFFVQKLDAKDLKDKNLTLSMKINGKVHSLSVVVSEENISNSMSVDEYSRIYLDYDVSNDLVSCGLSFYNGATPTIEWAKLEFGEHATPYVPRLYDEEWLICQRYYQYITARNSKLYLCNNNTVSFLKDFEIEMRATPTCNIEHLTLTSNTVEQSGFANGMIGATTRYVTFSFTKNSHGLDYTKYLSVNGAFSADAEL